MPLISKAPSSDIAGGGSLTGARIRPGEHERSISGYWLACLAVGITWAVVRLIHPVPWFPLDDAYITIHSAQVLHRGFDPNFPGVPALYGATSAPFLGLEYLLQFFLHPAYAASAACWLGVLTYALGLVYLTRSLKLGPYQSAAIVFLGVGSSFAPVHLLNGLETGFAMAGVAWTLAFSSGDGKHVRWAAVAGGLTAALRPDLTPFTVFVLAAMSYERWKRAEWTRREALLEFGKLVGLASLPMLPFAIWYLRQTGVPYPLTGLAKQYYFASGHLPAMRKLAPLGRMLGVYALSCGPLLLGVLCAWRSAVAKAIIAYALLVGMLAFWTLPDSLFFNIFRYPVVFIPMLVWGVAEWTSRRKNTDAGRLLIASCAGWCALLFPVGIRTYLNACRTCEQAERGLVSWCDGHLPPDAAILVQDAGYVAYGSHFRIVDYVGLKTPAAITLNREYTWPSAGAERGRAVAALSNATNARYLVVSPQFAPTNQLPKQLASLGWRLQELRSDGYYLVYRLNPPRTQ